MDTGIIFVLDKATSIPIRVNVHYICMCETFVPYGFLYANIKPFVAISHTEYFIVFWTKKDALNDTSLSFP